jgi:hypothetical protein
MGMFSLEQTIRDLAADFKKLNLAVKQSRDPGLAPRTRQTALEEIPKYEQNIVAELEELIRYPPHHLQYNSLLEAFYEKGQKPYDRSVFVMTKFPYGKYRNHPDDPKLNQVIEMVRQAIAKRGYFARVASDVQHHAMLWPNVELYLLACSKGVAIVENRYLPQCNPNVALEWGWMRAMGKPVLFLLEKDFQQEMQNVAADLQGFLHMTFAWDDPAQDIENAIANWKELK